MRVLKKYKSKLRANYVGVNNAIEARSISQFLTIVRRKLSNFYDSRLREYTPVIKDKAIYNGVRIDNESSYHLFDGITTATAGRKKYYEAAIVKGINSVIKEGDHVLIVGGGWGVSTVKASISAGVEGKITVYEASTDKIEDIENTLKLNPISSEIELNENMVAGNSSVWGEETRNEIVNPRDLPPADVLILDCEGAEKKILETLDYEPRAVVVEIHPEYGVRHNEIKSIMNRRGYQQMNHMFHPGEKVYSDISKYDPEPTSIVVFER